MKLKKIIELVSQAYDTDDPNLVRYYHEDPDGKYGDGLARFVAIEVKETYEPKATKQAQLAEARRVIEQGIRQMQAVVEALLKEEMTA